MNICEYDLGSILKAAEDLSQGDRPCLSLERIRARTGFTPARLVAALEYEPNPLGWHLTNEDAVHSDQPTFVVRGRAYTRLIIDRFTPQ